MIAAQNAGLGGFLADEGAREVWGESDVACGTARPTGRAVVVPGGYRVSGRWPFASGSSHATWFIGESTVYDGDSPKLDAGGNAMTRMAFMPRESVVIHDTWDTTGLRGTASNDFSCEDVFVPDRRAFQILVEEPHSDWALYRAVPLAFTNHGTQSLGVARAALDDGLRSRHNQDRLGWRAHRGRPPHPADGRRGNGARGVRPDLPLRRHGRALAGGRSPAAKGPRASAPACAWPPAMPPQPASAP